MLHMILTVFALKAGGKVAKDLMSIVRHLIIFSRSRLQLLFQLYQQYLREMIQNIS